MKKFQFISRFAASVAAVALTLGSAVSFTACSDDDEIDNSGIKSRLDVPTVNAVSAETDITKTSLAFSWEAVEDATGYQAQIRYSETGDIVREQISENTTITFENLNPGTQYFFRVCATYKYDEGRNSAYSAYVSATTEEADPTRPTFDVPAEVRCNMGATTAESLTFTWESVEGAQKYNVLLTAVGEDDRTFETTATSYTFNGLTTGMKYFFSVQVAEIPGETGINASNWSGAVKATTTAKLTTPQNLACKVKMAQAAQFVWDEVEGAVTYAYELTTLTASGTETTVTEGLMSELSDALVPGQTIYATATTNTSMTFRGLEKDTYYSFRVKAVPAAGQTETLESEFSDYCVIRTLAVDATLLATPSFKCTEAQQLKLIMAITPVDKAFGYDYQIATVADVNAGNEDGYILRQLRAGTDTPLATDFVVGPKVTDVNDESGVKAIELAPDTEYMIRMMTISDPNILTDGNSSWSEWTSVKTLELVKALTVATSEDLQDAFARLADGGVLTLENGDYQISGVTLSRAITVKGTDRGAKVVVNNIALASDVTINKIRFESIKFDGAGKDYLVDYTSAKNVVIKSFEFVNCDIIDYKTCIVRSKAENAQTVVSGLVSGCLVSGMNKTGKGYGFFGYDSATSESKCIQQATFENSTFANFRALLTASKVTANDTSVERGVVVKNCTFYNVSNPEDKTRICLDFNAGGSYKVEVSKCIFAKSAATGTNANKYQFIKSGSDCSVTVTDCYSTNDLIWTAEVVGMNLLNEAATDVFTDPAQGVFSFKNTTLKEAGIGDPRWLN